MNKEKIYPLWTGPPGGQLFTKDGDALFLKRPGLCLERIRWAENRRDLYITEVRAEDEGKYFCDHAGQRRSSVTVTPRSKCTLYTIAAGNITVPTFYEFYNICLTSRLINNIILLIG